MEAIHEDTVLRPASHTRPPPSRKPQARAWAVARCKLANRQDTFRSYCWLGRSNAWRECQSAAQQQQANTQYGGHPSYSRTHNHTVRILSYSRSDQSGNSRVGAPVSHRQLRDSTCSIFTLTSHCLHSSTRLSLIASSSTTGARYPRTNHTLSRLHSPPPFLFPLRLLTLLLYLGQQRSTPSRSRTALVRLLYIR